MKVAQERPELRSMTVDSMSSNERLSADDEGTFFRATSSGFHARYDVIGGCTRFFRESLPWSLRFRVIKKTSDTS